MTSVLHELRVTIGCVISPAFGIALQADCTSSLKRLQGTVKQIRKERQAVKKAADSLSPTVYWLNGGMAIISDSVHHLYTQIREPTLLCFAVVASHSL